MLYRYFNITKITKYCNSHLFNYNNQLLYLIQINLEI